MTVGLGHFLAVSLLVFLGSRFLMTWVIGRIRAAAARVPRQTPRASAWAGRLAAGARRLRSRRISTR